VPRWLLHHRHEPHECGVAFAAWKGHASLLRRRGTVCSCRTGDHAIWWVVDAPDAKAALELLPFFVATRTSAVQVGDVTIP
jgi:hypothetical protein